jgi:hypothetical protein
VQINVQDDVGATSTLTFAISTETVTLHLKDNGKGVGVGKYAEEEELFDVGWDITARKSFNGAYMKRFGVFEKNYATFQTRFSNFSGTGDSRQTIFIFGADNHIIINGIIRINNAGSVSWTGAGTVTGEAMAGGVVKITFPTTAYDWMMAISPDYFEIV